MRLLYGAIFCIILSLTTSYFLPNFNLGIGAISTLFTLSGIMFSIGMSLIVTFNTSGVKDKEFKNNLRNSLHFIQTKFIIIFFVISFFYIILTPYLKTDENVMLDIFNLLKVSYSQFLTYSMAYSIIYFVANFLGIEKLNYEIKEHIDKEEEEEKEGA